MSYIKGNFKKYIFRGDNNYVVGLFKIRETDLNIDSKTITFTGYFDDLNEMDLYKLEGELINHDKYGMGVVISIDGLIATISFKKDGLKKLLKNHKAIKKV